eukprot:1160582-Pelagomonas_calceolata.AAC.6
MLHAVKGASACWNCAAPSVLLQGTAPSVLLQGTVCASAHEGVHASCLKLDFGVLQHQVLQANAGKWQAQCIMSVYHHVLAWVEGSAILPERLSKPLKSLSLYGEGLCAAHFGLMSALLRTLPIFKTPTIGFLARSNASCEQYLAYKRLQFDQLCLLAQALECMHSNICQSWGSPWEAPPKRQKLLKCSVLGIGHSIHHLSP